MMAECRKEGPVRDALLFGSAGMTTSLQETKMEKSRRWQNMPGTCMLVDGAYGNTVQQKKWANDAN